MVKHTALVLGVLFILTNCSSADVGRLMENYLWEKRVLIIFSPSTERSNLKAQNRMLSAVKSGLRERDMVVWRLIDGKSVTVNGRQKPHLPTRIFYKHFKVSPEKFVVILLGKDGGEKLRKARRVTADELFALIDAMPMRQQEMREGRN
ncbi:MAG: DUF4174 domain-containing protein [Pseudomonadota bacterium]